MTLPCLSNTLTPAELKSSNQSHEQATCKYLKPLQATTMASQWSGAKDRWPVPLPFQYSFYARVIIVRISLKRGPNTCVWLLRSVLVLVIFESYDSPYKSYVIMLHDCQTWREWEHFYVCAHPFHDTFHIPLSIQHVLVSFQSKRLLLVYCKRVALRTCLNFCCDLFTVIQREPLEKDHSLRGKADESAIFHDFRKVGRNSMYC
jgi:hypothetical protein